MNKMRLINVTNSYSRLVRQQLENTDAELVKVYTSGNITVIYTAAPLHNEIVIVNKKRPITEDEILEIKTYFTKKLSLDEYNPNDIKLSITPGLVEISIPKYAKEKKYQAFG